jgi:hypothetical protein
MLKATICRPTTALHVLDLVDLVDLPQGAAVDYTKHRARSLRPVPYQLQYHTYTLQLWVLDEAVLGLSNGNTKEFVHSHEVGCICLQ